MLIVLLRYLAIQSIDRAIHSDAQHESGRWHPPPFWRVVVEEEVALYMRETYLMSTTTLGDIRYCLDGLSRFMRAYGFSETGFWLLMSRGYGHQLLAVGQILRI